MTNEAKNLLLPLAITVVVMALISIDQPFHAKFVFDPADLRPAIGWAALALGLTSVAYSVRKRVYLQAPWALIIWKMAHVITGYVFLALMFLHANGTVGSGAQLLLSALAAGITLTGLWGIVSQGLIPKVMTDTLLDPVYKSEVADSVKKVLLEIKDLLKGASQPFNVLYQRHILPFITIKLPTADQHKAIVRRLFGPASADPNAAVKDLDPLSAEERDLFYNVAEKSLDIVELRLSQTYQARMNQWLLWHIGLSVMLGTTLLFHILAAYYF